MIGLTSSTTTVTFRTARVFANSSPIPDAPRKRVKISLKDLIMEEHTTSNENNLFTPVKGCWSEKEASLIAVQL